LVTIIDGYQSSKFIVEDHQEKKNENPHVRSTFCQMHEKVMHEKGRCPLMERGLDLDFVSQTELIALVLENRFVQTANSSKKIQRA